MNAGETRPFRWSIPDRFNIGADVVDRHAAAGIELRIVPRLPPLWERVVASTLEFSGIRLRNLGPR